MNWTKHGLILEPRPEIGWLKTCAGPTFALHANAQYFHLYIAGRDDQNRSRIGRAVLDIDAKKVVSVDEKPLIDLGELGTFDFNGTSYPWLVQTGEELRLYYTGWTIGYHVAFINDLGLAIQKNNENEFHKVSRAPLISRTNEEPFGTGSVCVLKDDSNWKMWYTTFESWGDQQKADKHYYHIRYAESEDGLIWNRPNKIAVNFDSKNGEYVTGKPSVIKYKNRYLMWFSFRGESYRLGFAISHNGIDWKRMDSQVGIDVSSTGFDSEMICYGHIFIYQDLLYMVYNGNGYGKSGLGLASLPLKDLDNFLETV
jgi:hypothetical protein